MRQLLESVIASASEPDRERLFGGAAALCKPLFTSAVAQRPASSADSVFAMLHGLYWLLSNLAAESPAVLCVDDLHWSDWSSLRFLAYLAPRLEGLGVAVLVSARPGEGDQAGLARLAEAPETTVIRPRPLSREATAHICERVLGDGVTPEFSAACHQATGGNPFFLEALLRESREEGIRTDAGGVGRVREVGPTTVARAVLLRLSTAPAAATRVVRAVAVLGDGASIAHVALLAEISEDEALEAADLLVTLGVFTAETRLEFIHPIVREAVYSDIGSHERAEAHARAAVILAASSASEERIAAQIVEAEPVGDPERVKLLRQAAAEALVRGAPAAAVAWLDRALAEPPPAAAMGELLLELGSAEQRFGTPLAVDHLAAAVDSVRDPELLATAARRLALALTMSANSDRAVEVLEGAIEVIEATDRELGLLLEAELHAHAQQASLEARAPAARRLKRHGDLAGVTPGERLVLASLAFERARASQSASEATAHIERALAGGRLLSEQELDVAGPFYHLVLGLLATDALDLADACLEQAFADAHARSSIPAIAYVTYYRGRVALRRGALEQAEADARSTVELLTTHGIRFGITTAPGLVVEALIERGDLEAAARALRGADLTAETGPGLTSNFLLEARSLLQLAQGRTLEGLAGMREFGRLDELWGFANPLAVRWRSHAALALAKLGEGDEARRMAVDDLRRARSWGAASGVGLALRAVALLEGGTVAIDRLREAVKVLERSPSRLEHARALVDLGAALRRANRRADARGALAEGLDWAERCGARELAGRARTELLAAGGRSSVPEGTGIQQLTASERRVAELAAGGQSNPEIAQALFVTRKTVETHLGRVYRKLAISGRRELGAILSRATTPPDR